MSTTILHLSDVHTGPGELTDVDQKEKVEEAVRAKRLDHLTNYLHALPTKPDYVAITGDITIKSAEEGFKLFRGWLFDRIQEKVLPEEKRIIIVPGNHDVTWGIPKRPTSNQERFGQFWKILGKAFPHAHIPDCDPALDASKPTIEKTSKGLIGGLTTELERGEVVVKESFPFLLDLDRDVLIFAFNSAHGCGIRLDPDLEIIEPLDALSKLYKETDVTGEKIRSIRARYLKSLIVDAGLITEDQLKYFASLMVRFKKLLGDRYDRLTKIALLHHHVSHLWRQQLEVKRFESVLDASQLKEALIEWRFDFVLHGHKHTNHVGLDGSLIPISNPRSLNPLCIVSGGTISGYPRVGDHQTFKLINLKEEHGPRTTASIIEVPITETANPGAAIRWDSKIYTAPISSRLPQLHDLSSIKNSLDEMLCKHCAPELDEPSNPIWKGGDSVIPPAIPSLVGRNSRYRFYCRMEKGNERIFYDILLAVDRLGFRQQARVYWMMTDVMALTTREKKAYKVVLLVGNLEKTHFFQGLQQGEVAKSIADIQRWFAPAIKSKLLEVRVHVFSQKQVEAVVRSMAKAPYV